MYKLIKEIKSEVFSVLKQDGDVLYCIPFDEANTDYQAYLKWISEGNTPEAAE